MTKHYIQVDDNNGFVGHPITENNMRRRFPAHDFDSGPPSGFMEFVWVSRPNPGPYKTFDDAVGAETSLSFPHNGLTYEIVDGKYTHVWHLVDLSAAQIAAKKQAAHDFWAATHNYASWTFDEDTCLYVPPVPYPDNTYTPADWDEDAQDWLR